MIEIDSRSFYDTLDGLFAYDTGCVNSGVNDNELRHKLSNYLNSLDEEQFRIEISLFVRNRFLSDEMLKKGYGIEDVVSFIRWLDRFMDIQL